MADKYPNLVGTNTVFEDGGLQAPQTVDLGDSLLVIGTASKGQLLQPIQITTLDDAIVKFGPFGNGSLVRGIFEAMNASNRAKDIRGMRIGAATKSVLNLAESPSGVMTTRVKDATRETDGTAIADALSLEAKNEGIEV